MLQVLPFEKQTFQETTIITTNLNDNAILRTTFTYLTCQQKPFIAKKIYSLTIIGRAAGGKGTCLSVVTITSPNKLCSNSSTHLNENWSHTLNDTTSSTITKRQCGLLPQNPCALSAVWWRQFFGLGAVGEESPVRHVVHFSQNVIVIGPAFYTQTVAAAAACCRLCNWFEESWGDAAVSRSDETVVRSFLSR